MADKLYTTQRNWRSKLCKQNETTQLTKQTEFIVGAKKKKKSGEKCDGKHRQ